MTQAQVAARMSVGKSRIGQIEKGRVSTRDVLDRYVEALGGRLSLMADFVARGSIGRVPGVRPEGSERGAARVQSEPRPWSQPADPGVYVSAATVWGQLSRSVLVMA